MVKALRLIPYYLRLVRWPNLLVVALTQFMVRYFIIQPILSDAGLQLQLSNKYFVIIVIATILISAAGYIINDYFDRKIDFINRPYRVIVGKVISRRMAITLHTAFSILGIILGTYVAYKLNLLYLSAIFILVSTALWFYSTHYKKRLLIGNLVIAIMVALVPLIILLFEFPLLVRQYQLPALAVNISIKSIAYWVGGYAGYAFLLNLIREIVKDMEDHEGDANFGRTTIPIKWGIAKAKLIAGSLTAICILATLFILMFKLDGWFAQAYGIVFMIFPMVVFVFMLQKASNKKSFYKLSQLLKVIMVLGLSFCIVYHYF